MKRVIPALVLAVGTLCVAELAAQGRNFAGTWTIDTERTAAANAGAVAAGGAGGGARGGGGGGVARGGGGGGVMVPVPNAAGAGGGGMRSGGGGGGGRGMAGPMTLAIDATSFTVGQGETSTVYRLDGSTSTIPSARGDIIAKTSWKGDQLVIESTAPGPNGPLVTTTSWHLEGDALVRVTSNTLPDGQTVTRTTYFKRS